jgi:hypothetical protein
MNRKLEVQHQCVELRKTGLSYRQIGHELKITRDMVAGHLFRARKAALRRGLDPLKVGGEDEEESDVLSLRGRV